MKFKKLLSMIGMISIVAPASLSVVACNPVINTDNITAKQIEKELEAGIDASNLKISDSEQQGLTLLQALKEVKGTAILKFVNEKDASKKLDEGTNTLNIYITVGVARVQAAAQITNVNKSSDQKVIDGINGVTYTLPNVKDGDSIASVKASITSDFIKVKLTADLQKVYLASDFKFIDITVKGKSLTSQDLQKIGDIQAKITYTYAGVSEVTNLTITVSDKYNYADIQAELIKNITAQPLVLTVGTYNNRDDGETAVQKELQDNVDKYFKSNLSDAYLREFNAKCLGLYNHVYSKDEIGPTNYVASDFFTKAATTTVYFYIGYNKTAQTDTGGGLIPIILTVKVNSDDQKVIDGINGITYTLPNVKDGDSVASVKANITNNFISSQLSLDLQKIFDNKKFIFADITVDGKSLTAENLQKIDTINAKITYTYAGISESTNLTITVSDKYNYDDIQAELIKNITAKPLVLTVNTYNNRSDGEVAVQKQLQDGIDKYFKSNLSDAYSREFDAKYLGLYDHVYNKPSDGNYVDSDFFTKAATTTVYFYIGYNETAQTTTGGGYIPIKLTVVASQTNLQTFLENYTQVHPLTTSIKFGMQDTCNPAIYKSLTMDEIINQITNSKDNTFINDPIFQQIKANKNQFNFFTMVYDQEKDKSGIIDPQRVSTYFFDVPKTTTKDASIYLIYNNDGSKSGGVYLNISVTITV